MRFSGSNATSASRLFWIIRYAASMSQFLQVSSVPVGAFMFRGMVSVAKLLRVIFNAKTAKFAKKAFILCSKPT